MLPADEPVAINTGPLIALSACDAIGLLRHLHARILLPQAVLEEYTRGRSGAAAPAALPAWLEVQGLNGPIPPVLAAHLDDGEASAIALALEQRIRIVALDERRGRLIARSVGLDVTGSVGFLLRAKRLGLIDAIAPRLDMMRRHGVWLADSLLERVLREAGETELPSGT